MGEQDYRQGFIDGLACFAWWKDGTEWVGTCGTRLRDAVENVETLFNYRPPPPPPEDPDDD